MTDPAPESAAPSPRWRPLNSIDRRVLGVLGEKAKTTPDTYPMSLNGVKALASMSYRESEILKLRTWLDDGTRYTQQECAHIFKVPFSLLRNKSLIIHVRMRQVFRSSPLRRRIGLTNLS